MSRVHGVRRLADGHLRVRLSTRERDLLRSLPAQLRSVLTGEQPSAGARDRLFPHAYDDPLDELEYRELVGPGLLAQHLEAVDVFARTLDQGQVGRLTWTVELSAEEAGAWLSAVNDARLTLGSLLGITSEDQWERGPDRNQPSSVALWYLGWLEEELVAALMTGLPDPAGS
ncbi:MAG: DUF2017 domain-containing protein [Actinomycetota bacterium]|nr:DUF2017 domain-containing protein [Actinomycetota bacterium]